MLIRLRKRTAQSTLEYAVLVVVVIGALLSIQHYLRRGISGKIKGSTDDISQEQFEMNATNYNKTTTTYSSTTDEQDDTGSHGTTHYSNTTINASSITPTPTP